MLVSSTMITQAGSDSWSELLTLGWTGERARSEQCCTPMPPWMCHLGRAGTWERLVHPFLMSVRRFVAFWWDSVKKHLTMETHHSDLPSQRMCPFCGLITARSKAFCLECGKSLREVHP